MKTTEKLRTEKATRPASKWRNRYFCLRSHTDGGGRHLRGGQEFLGTLEWPSRDTAETYAQRMTADNPHLAEYIGAFPMEGS